MTGLRSALTVFSAVLDMLFELRNDLHFIDAFEIVRVTDAFL